MIKHETQEALEKAKDLDHVEVETRPSPHHMIREIYEQPNGVAETLAVCFQDARRIVEQLDPEKIGMVYFTGSGTSYHACLAANYALAGLTKIFTSSLPASEFPSWVRQMQRKQTILIAISQSGESVDVNTAVRTAVDSDMRVVAVTNTPESTLAKSSELRMVSKAGEEKAVTATKSFTATLAAAYALVLELARGSGISPHNYENLAADLKMAPDQVRQTLALCDAKTRALSAEFEGKEFFFILGSGPNYATALEGALKLKESCNLYAEGFASREFLHGPMQLVDHRTPVFILESPGETEQARRLTESFQRFGAPTVLIRQTDGQSPSKEIGSVEVSANSAEIFSPLSYVVPLQLYAYYSSVIRGLNPDRPEKLKKVVK